MERMSYQSCHLSDHRHEVVDGAGGCKACFDFAFLHVWLVACLLLGVSLFV